MIQRCCRGDLEVLQRCWRGGAEVVERRWRGARKIQTCLICMLTALKFHPAANPAQSSKYGKLA